MRIESASYASRWRGVAPSAKAVLALAGAAAAWLAHSLSGLALLVGLQILASVLGARVPLHTYLAVAAAPIGFLLLSCATRLAAPDADGAWQLHLALLPTVAHDALRSLAVLAALLGLVLTTPMPDLLALLRRLRAPALLLDLMALSYRMLFVLRQAWEEGISAQQARLGHHGWRNRWRSTGLLGGQMAVQVWQRAASLQMAADARACQGSLRFLPTHYPHAVRQNAWALLGGALLLALGACL